MKKLDELGTALEDDLKHGGGFLRRPRAKWSRTRKEAEVGAGYAETEVAAEYVQADADARLGRQAEVIRLHDPLTCRGLSSSAAMRAARFELATSSPKADWPSCPGHVSPPGTPLRPLSSGS